MKSTERDKTTNGRVAPDVRPTTIRLDDATRAAVEEEAHRRGMNSAGEYMRSAIIAQLAWDRAMRVMQAGGDASYLASLERLAESLARASQEKPKDRR